MFQPREVLEKPYFKIEIDGEQLPPLLHAKVQEVEVDEIDEKADIARIVFQDADSSLLKDPRLEDKAKIEIEMGHIGGAIDVKFKGKLNSVEPDFNANGITQVVVKALDESNDMHNEEKSRSWEDEKKSEVVEEILQENGFTPIIETRDTEEPVEVLTQDSETDMQFIKRLAEEDGYHAYRETDYSKKEFYYGVTKKGESPQGVLRYGLGDTAIIAFRPDFHPDYLEAQTDKEDIDDADVEDIDAEGNKHPERVTGEGAGTQVGYDGEEVQVAPRYRR